MVIGDGPIDLTRPRAYFVTDDRGVVGENINIVNLAQSTIRSGTRIDRTIFRSNTLGRAE